MSRAEEALSKVFDIDVPEIVEKHPPVPAEITLPAETLEPDANTPSTLQDDYNLAQKTLKDVIEKGKTALDEIMSVAKADEKARSYEVVATLMKTVADTAKQLLDLQRTMNELKPKGTEPTPGVNYIDKAVFVGNPADLLDRVKYQQTPPNG